MQAQIADPVPHYFIAFTLVDLAGEGYFVVTSIFHSAGNPLCLCVLLAEHWGSVREVDNAILKEDAAHHPCDGTKVGHVLEACHTASLIKTLLQVIYRWLGSV